MIYEYRTLRIERAVWAALAPAFGGEVAEATHTSGGSVFALFAGMIGLATDEGVLVRAWPDAETLAREVVCLPVHPFLSQSDVDRVCEAVLELARRG